MKMPIRTHIKNQLFFEEEEAILLIIMIIIIMKNKRFPLICFPPPSFKSCIYA